MLRLSAMEEEEKPQNSVWHAIISGEGCCRGDSFMDNKIVHRTPHPIVGAVGASNFDFGQRECIDNFNRSMQRCVYTESTNENLKFLIAAAGRGTPTVVNWLAEQSHEDQEKNAHFLVFESFVGSGNSLHTKNAVPYAATLLPFARAWLPLINKGIFPAYKPWGQQAYSSAKKLSPNIPAVLMHHVNDPHHSINDTRELYCTLRENNNNNVYLFEIDNQNNSDLRYHDILNSEMPMEKNRKIRALQFIYRRHGAPHDKESANIYPKYHEEKEKEHEGNKETDPLAEFQPDIQEIRQRIYNSTWKTYYLRNTIDFCTATLFIGGFALWYYKKYVKGA